MKTDGKYDVVVIGGGPGGTPAAMQLASMGKKVLLVESSGKLGGACLFSGCIPSKIIRHSANEYHRSMRPGLDTDPPANGAEKAWGKAVSRMEHVLAGRSSAAGRKAGGMENLEFVAGVAQFLSSREIGVEALDGTISRYTFSRALVATGSVPVIPPVDGDGVRTVLTSESFFARRELPSSMVIVGGGPIGVEMAQILVRMGVRCTIIEMAGFILDHVCEPEFRPRIQEALEREGVDIFTSSTLSEISRTGGGYDTTFIDGGGSNRTITSEQVLMAAGRAPNVKNLGLETAGIRFSRAGIQVNQYLETSVNGIYATGDVIEGPRFAHTATHEAHIAAVNMAGGNSRTMDFSINSWVLFTDPEMASAGLTEAQTAGSGLDITSGIYDFATDAAAQVEDLPEGQLKFVVNKGSGKIIGVHILGPHAGSLAGEAALIVGKGLTLSDVAQVIHPHPTWNESFGLLALNMLSSLH